MSGVDRRTRRARRIAAVISILALGAIFGAVGRLVPTSVFPRVPWLIDLIPHINAILSVTALTAIGLGIHWIRRGYIYRHRLAMLLAVGQFLAFLGLYLYKVIMVGTATFPGSEFVYTYLYLPILGIHILLAIVCVPLVFYVLALAGVHDISRLRDTPHPNVGRIAATLWAISFVLGLVVYGLLYGLG